MIKYRVVLVRPTYEGNIGAVARAMMNFGFSELIIVSSQCEIGLEARQRAMHAYPILKKAKMVTELKEATDNVDIVIGTTGVDSSSRRNISRQSMDPRFFAMLSSRINGKGALLFGSEADGLLNTEINQCDFVLTIPADPIYPILNLSHAVALLLYELYTATGNRSVKSIKNKEKMNGTILHILYDYIDKLLDDINYPLHRRYKISMQLKRIIAKSWPTESDTQALLGVIKKTTRAIEKQKAK